MTKKRKPAADGRTVRPMVRHPGLYRAQLSCRIARDVLDGKTAAPAYVSHMEWAMYNLLHAVEEIATAMMPERSGSEEGRHKMTKTRKAKKFRCKASKRKCLATVLDELAQAVRCGDYGPDGCECNAQGYYVEDVIGDATKGFLPFN